jgi:hypothetical protein
MSEEKQITQSNFLIISDGAFSYNTARGWFVGGKPWDPPMTRADRLFCGCSGDEIFDIFNNLDIHKNNKDLSDTIHDLLNIIDEDTNIIPFEDIGKNAQYAIEWCVDFLLLKKDYDNEIEELSLKLDSIDKIHRTKYITLWSFIYDFLKIQRDSGYDYWLMNALEWYNIIEHGSGIRCSWFNVDDTNIFIDRILSEERKDIILTWIKNAPNDI